MAPRVRLKPCVAKIGGPGCRMIAAKRGCLWIKEGEPETAWGRRRGLPAPVGQPGSSQTGCFLPWLTPHPGAGPRLGSEEGQCGGSATCGRKISARGREVITGLPCPLGGGVARVFGRPSGAPDSYLRVSRLCTNYLKLKSPSRSPLGTDLGSTSPIHL